LAAARIGTLSFVLAALALVAAPRPEAATGATHTVAMDGTAFRPSSQTIKLGDTIVWKNNDPFPHTATSRSQAFDSKPVMPGKSFTFTPRMRGDFPYVCTLHPTMKGTVHVE
jgi:plastocyanin